MSAQSFRLLFSSIRIGNVELRNRLVLTGHGTGMGRDFRPNEQLVHYYAERAKGGVGLMMVGSQQVHPTSPGITNLLCNYDDSIIPGLRAIADAVHAHGGRVFGLLSHMGLASSARPQALWSASAVYEEKYGEVAHAMTPAEIAEIVEAFAAAAARNVEAGMDGIELSGGHGLLIHQFMSPYSNKRTDDYGGSMAKRLRFPMDVLRRVRQAIGPDRPLGIRISGDELIEGGLTLEDMKQMAPRLIEAGRLDYIDVSAGNDGDIMSNMLHEPPMGLPPANFAYLAAGIKEVVDVPVIHGTRINSPALAEKLLADGMTDLVGMCRPLIADPHLPNKAREGRVDDISLCVACEQACLGRLHRGKHISCVGNPITGRETEWATLAPAAVRKKVVVVGGGVAGMEAAIVARRRGHDVVLIEKSIQLGGQVLVAANAPTRDELAELARYRAVQVKKLGIRVELGVEATVETIVQEGPDAAVIATGADPSRPAIPGADRKHVFTVGEVLMGTVEVGNRVVLVDYVNRQRGPTTACYLADRGKQVEILTQGPHVGHKLETQNFAFGHYQLFAKGVVLTPHTVVTAIEDNRIVVRNRFTGAERVIDGVDTVVLATPGRANDRLFHELEGRVAEVHVVGDCLAPRDVEAAILEGHQAGRAL